MGLTKRGLCWTSVLGLLFWLFLGVGASFAHPMGNFSVNHYGKIKINATSVEILYLIDMAEIPTYQEMRDFGIVARTDDPSALRYLERQELRLKEGLVLESDGERLNLETISRHAQFADGAGGLPTMKLLFVFRGKLDGRTGAHKLNYDDRNFPGRAGWKEIVVLSEETEILQCNAKTTDRSGELTTYSTNLLNSPPQQLTAAVEFRTASSSSTAQIQGAQSGSGVHHRPSKFGVPRANVRLAPLTAANKTHSAQGRSLAGQPPQNNDAAEIGQSSSTISAPRNTPRSRFTDLISTRGELGFWFLLSAALISAGLGALHALEPGHGKTIVAAYLVGSRGTARHAVLLGFVVTAAHTSGVYLLGLVTLYASRYIVPEQLYPWLGCISGVTVAGLGVFMFLKHRSGETGEHPHSPGENHSHWFLSMFKTKVIRPGHSEPPEERTAEPVTSNAPGKATVSLRELCVLGITGGIVPCPAALVVLLSAFSLHRIRFGLFLIAAFSLGLAVVLVVVGLTMVYSKRFIASRLKPGGGFVRFLPGLSSAFMIVIGIGIAVSALASAPVGLAFVSKQKLFPFVTVIVLGLFLGMRHSTDPDHVVAVTTIVSRQRSIKSSASIGLLWGLGHTLTIFLVGSAIIIFGVVIPPRLGLSMEFCVALMLILLGLLNLTGITKSITERSTPNSDPRETATLAGDAGLASIGPTPKPGFANRFKSSFRNTIGRLGVYQTVRPLVIGLVHGLAGSAAVALLVLSTIKSPFWATAYLLVFGFGTMLGMMVMTTAMSLPLVYAGNRFFKINGRLSTISGIASMAFGMFLVYHIALVDGLFLARPHWIPQ